MSKSNYRVVVRLNDGVPATQIKVIIKDGADVEISQTQNVPPATDVNFNFNNVDDTAKAAVLVKVQYFNGTAFIDTTAGVTANATLDTTKINGINFLGLRLSKN